MGTFAELILGLFALLFTAIATGIFGVGGFLFSVGLIIVLIFAFSGD